MSSELSFSEYVDSFRDKGTILALSKEIKALAKQLPKPIKIMEVCGGHTHTIMKYGINQLLPENIEFIHGPGCPVCVMPKNRIDHAYALSLQPNVILVTLGDMIKVPGSNGSLQDARSKGADVRYAYSPLDSLKIAKENPDKSVIYFAIGFETTTPMTAALIEQAQKEGVENLLYHVNHVVVPEPVEAIMDDGRAQIDAFIGPSHVSVITGAKIYAPIVEKYRTPIAVSGFEPVDVLAGVKMIVEQMIRGEAKLEIQYTRSVSMEGNLKAQALMEKYFTKCDFQWRGLGVIKDSALRLKDEYAHLDAEIRYQAILPKEAAEEHKLCLCGEILKGLAKPDDCKIFRKLCTPQNPLGSCMVSSEGACAAYYKYGNFI